MEQGRLELVFVPSPGMGHLIPTVELAKLLVRYDHRLSVTIIILKIHFDPKITAYTDTLSATTRLNFVTVLLHQPGSEAQNLIPLPQVLFPLIEQNKHLVKDAVDGIVRGIHPTQLAGLVVDMFCTPVIDVADEFGVPAYLYFTSSAASLAFMFFVQELIQVKKVDTTTFQNSEDLLDMPFFRNRYPTKLLPEATFIPEMVQQFAKVTERFRGMKGMIVNSFEELESYAIHSLFADRKIPSVYPVGPVLNLDGQDSVKGNEEVMTWLDDQPPMSVVFLCFGSLGSFCVEQVREIAAALERSGHRFLWSIRRQMSMSAPTDYENLEEVLPEGFLRRTAGIGKVMGWAPQMAVLGHVAVGGFVSHCGWNSILESMWFGVPVAAWPMYAEQPFNAFEVVVELGLGVEVCMGDEVVTAVEIESAIERLMEQDSDVRKRVREVSKKSRQVLTEGGSSNSNLASFIGAVVANMP